VLFALDDFERDVLLLAVAPELDLRYEVLYSYLNNDVEDVFDLQGRGTSSDRQMPRTV
jgi:hypothetical protein